MRVLYDSQIFSLQRHGGISRLFSELFRYYHQRNALEWDIRLHYPDNTYIRQLQEDGIRISDYSRFFGGVAFRGKGRIYSLYRKMLSRSSERAETLRSLTKGQCQIFHPTYFDDYFLEELGSTPLVLTVYDMVHELFPDAVTGNHVSKKKQRLVERASKIIAISESTKNDLIRLFNIDGNKIEVIYLGSALGLKSIASIRMNKPEKYMLFVGQREGYKNFLRMLRAVAPLMSSWRSLHLVCIGGGATQNNFSKEEQRVIFDCNLAGRVSCQIATEDELAEWYRDALCLVYPSIYEGFGIPLVEAFGCGCPVVASDVAALREVGDEAVEYFDPLSEESIRDVVANVLASPSKRADLVAEGRHRGDYFSWERAAVQTIQVYKAIVRQS